jgi:CheY-like chemotaxis protein
MTDTPQNSWYVFDEQTRILVVDDDPILREFASVYLTTPMSKVALAPDASTALDVLAREQFDIALIDIDMPGMDGFELVECIRGQDKLRNLPIVMVTGREDIVSIDRAYAAGANVVRHQAGQLRQPQSPVALCHSGEQTAISRTGARRTPALRAPVPRPGCPPQRGASSRRRWDPSSNSAKRIANGRAQSGEAAQEIIAAARGASAQVRGEPGSSRRPSFDIPAAAQQSLPRAS